MAPTAFQKLPLFAARPLKHQIVRLGNISTFLFRRKVYKDNLSCTLYRIMDQLNLESHGGLMPRRKINQNLYVPGEQIRNPNGKLFHQLCVAVKPAFSPELSLKEYLSNKAA